MGAKLEPISVCKQESRKRGSTLLAGRRNGEKAHDVESQEPGLCLVAPWESLTYHDATILKILPVTRYPLWS